MAAELEALVRNVILAGLVAATPAAQLQFDELTKQVPLPGGNRAQAGAVGDVDGDGDADVVFGELHRLELYLNDGSGRFTDASATHLPAGTSDVRHLTLVDIDADGDLDLFIANWIQSLFPLPDDRLYLNDGTGRYSDVTATRFPASRGLTDTVAAGDVDGDGDPDLVLGQQGPQITSQTHLYLNDGSGSFTASSPRPPGNVGSVLALGDVDSDGDLDLVTGHLAWGSTPIHLLENDGQGGFVDVTRGRVPFLGPPPVETLDLVDHDRDGDLDVFVGRRGPLQLLDNDGLGNFVDGSSAIPSNPAKAASSRADTGAIAFADVDGDGWVDLLHGFRPVAGLRTRLLLNDRVGGFTDATSQLPSDRCGCQCMVLLDAEGDGDLDVLGASTGDHELDNRLWLNDGFGVFTNPTPRRLPAHRAISNSGSLGATWVALADVDNDRDMDLLVGTEPELYLNDGRASFIRSSMPPALLGTSDGILGDMDGDGDLDLILASTTGNRIYINGGPGTFTDMTAAHLPYVPYASHTVAIADIDADGDLDVCFGTLWGMRLYANDGRATLTDVSGQLPSRQSRVEDLVFADIDGDGDVDLLSAQPSWQVRGPQVYMNDGRGFFRDATALRFPLSPDVSCVVAVADIDSDGDLDVFAGTRGQDLLFVNNGFGFFSDATSSQLPPLSESTLGAKFGDLDDDGDTDLVTNGPHLYENDGEGVFSEASPARLTSAAILFDLGDVDGDGDLDVVAAMAGTYRYGQTRLFLNRLRQIHSPVQTRRGGQLTLEFHSSPDFAWQPAAAFPFVACATSRVHVAPFGVFGLLQAQTVALPPIFIPPSTGRASLSLFIPGDPGALGARIYAQALISGALEPFSASRLTNVTEDVVTN